MDDHLFICSSVKEKVRPRGNKTYFFAMATKREKKKECSPKNLQNESELLKVLKHSMSIRTPKLSKRKNGLQKNPQTSYSCQKRKK